MDTADFTGRTEEFTLLAENISAILSGFQEQIAARKVPDPEDIDNLVGQLQNLREIYSSTVKAAEEILAEEERPEEGSSLDSYAAALDASRKARAISERMANVQGILQKFTSVQATQPEYSSALKTYQEDAQKLSAKLSIDELENIAQEAEKYEAFLSVLVGEGTSGVFASLKNFSSEVLAGLLGHVYYIGSDGEQEQEQETEQEQDDDPEPSTEIVMPLNKLKTFGLSVLRRSSETLQKW